MNICSSSPRDSNLGSYPSFDVFAKRLKKAEGFEDVNLRLPFPQILCQSPLSNLATRSLTPDHFFFQPLQELIQQLDEKIKTFPPTKNVRTLQKIEAAYRAFIQEICQTTGDTRTQLLDTSPSFVHQLVKHNQLASIGKLIEQKTLISHSTNARGISLLHLAAGEGHKEMTLLLLQAGIPIDSQDREGRTPLHHAVLKGQIEVTRQLIAEGANVLALSREKESVLHLAASYGHVELMNYLLTQPCQELLQAGDSDGKTPLHHAVWGNPKEQIVQLLLDQGAIVDARNNFGYTPLHWAAKHGHLASTELLFAKGADAFITNANGDTPLDLALHWKQDCVACYLIDPTGFKKELSVIPEEQDLEGFYYQCFEKAYQEGAGGEQLFYLQKMGALYLEKGQYFVAAHLLNNAFALAVRLSFPDAYQHYLLKKLEQIEECYLEKECGLKTSTRRQDYLKVYRQDLKEIRNGVHVRLDQKVAPRQIQLGLAKGLEHLLARLIEECIELLQEKIPTSFAVIGLGSMSRQEMAPYSDIEFAILIQESTPAIQEYFRRLSRLLELKIINLGETKYDLIRPRRVGNCFLPSHSFTPHGFSLDSGGLSPLGKAGVYELIGTSRDIARFQTDEWLSKNEGEIILVYAMTSYCHVAGKKQLVDLYEKHVIKILNKRNKKLEKKRTRQLRALDLLKGHLEEFKPFLGGGRLEVRAFDVKKDLYRPIQMVVGALRLYYGLRSQNTFDLLQELEQHHVMSAEIVQALQKTLSQIVSLRLRLHLFYQNEKEILYYSRGERDLEAQGLYLAQEEEAHLTLEIYRVLVPLQKLAQSFVQGNQKAFTHPSCYDASIGMTTPEAEDLLNYELAESSYTQRAALNPNDQEALNDLQRIKRTLGQAQEALTYNLDRLMILKKKHGDTPHSLIVDTLSNLGVAYQALGEASRAIGYFEQSLSMEKQLYNEKSYPRIAAILNNLGVAYSHLGEYQKAIDHFNQSLAMDKQCYGDRPRPSIAMTLSNLGQAYDSLGESKKAISYFKSSLAINREFYGHKPHPETSTNLNNLGAAYKSLGKIQKAIGCFEQSLTMDKHLYGDKSHPSITMTLSNLGVIHSDLGEFQKAIAYFKQSLVIGKQLYGDKPHASIAKSLNNLGLVYKRLGEAQEAMTCFEQSLAIDQQLYGGKAHPDVALTLNNLGSTYGDLGEFQKAIRHCEQSLAIHEQVYGDKPHPERAQILSNLGMSYNKLGDAQRARNYFEQSLAINKQVYGDNPHLEIATNLNNLGSIYDELGECEKALTHYEQSLAINKQLYGSKPHPLIATNLNNLGMVYQKLERIQTAIPYFEQSLAMRKQLYHDKSHVDIATSLNNLGHAYDNLGEAQKAIDHLEKSLAMGQQLYDNKPHPLTASTLNNLGMAYNNLGNTGKTIAYYEQSVAMKKQLYNDQLHPGIANTLNNLGDVYKALGDIPKAIVHYEQALTYGDKPHPTITMVLNNLGLIYWGLKENHKAIAYYEQALAMGEKLYGNHPHFTTAILLSNLAHAYRSLGEIELTIVYFEQCLEMNKQLHGGTIPRSITKVLIHLGDAYQALGQFQQAVIYYAQAKAL